MTQSNVRAAFERHFNTHGTLYASAGRINLIGEHTDYNGGFVFPGAVDCGITAMIRPNGTDRVRAYAVVGSKGEGAERAAQCGFSGVTELMTPGMTLEYSMSHTAELVEKAVLSLPL